MRALAQVPDTPVRYAQLDARVRNKVCFPNSVTCTYVKRSLGARLAAEWLLAREVCCNDITVCLHGLPPIFRLSGQVAVFLQNRLLLESGRLTGYPWLTKTRLLVERSWLRTLRKNSSRYIVQTPSMATALKMILGNESQVTCFPFIPDGNIEPAKTSECNKTVYDFLYVAHGDVHKNHKNLLEAWYLLSTKGIKPSLALTVDPQLYPALCKQIIYLKKVYGLNIYNIGTVPSGDMPALYQKSEALIYPSKSESFGLPLLEARSYNLPIIASELDYVRDVVEPSETFSPDSPVSIARAVRRFMGNAQPPVKLRSAAAFWEELLR